MGPSPTFTNQKINKHVNYSCDDHGFVRTCHSIQFLDYILTVTKEIIRLSDFSLLTFTINFNLPREGIEIGPPLAPATATPFAVLPSDCKANFCLFLKTINQNRKDNETYIATGFMIVIETQNLTPRGRYQECEILFRNNEMYCMLQFRVVLLLELSLLLSF